MNRVSQGILPPEAHADALFERLAHAVAAFEEEPAFINPLDPVGNNATRFSSAYEDEISMRIKGNDKLHGFYSRKLNRYRLDYLSDFQGPERSETEQYDRTIKGHLRLQMLYLIRMGVVTDDSELVVGEDILRSALEAEVREQGGKKEWVSKKKEARELARAAMKK